MEQMVFPVKMERTGKTVQMEELLIFTLNTVQLQNPTSASQMSEIPDTYIGTYVDFTEKDSTDPTKYTWSKFEGRDGAKGIPGTNGIDGKTSYLHIAYANSAGWKNRIFCI